MDSGTRRYWLLLAAWALPNALLVSLINVALPDIQADFGVTSSALAWAASAYIIAGAVGAVIYGRLGDVLGTRTAALWCIAGFVVSTALAAAAPAYSVLIAARLAQGLFGMALPVLALAAIVSEVPEQHRTRAVGAVMIAFGVAAVGGSIGGGVLVHIGGWRLPIATSGLIGAALLVPVRRMEPLRPAADARIGFDAAGGFVAAIAVAATLVAANQLPRVGGERVGAPALLVATVGWIAFLRWISTRDDPFIDPVVLRSPRFLLVCALGGSMQAMFVASGFVTSLVLHHVHGRSTTAIGALLAPGFAAVLVAGIACPRLVLAFGERTVATGGVAVSVIGAATAASGALQSVPSLVFSYICLGIGYSLTQAILMRRTGELMPGALASTGMGFYNFAYFASGALAVAVAGGVIERRLLVGDAWNPLHRGAGAAYVDAYAVLFVFAVAAVAILAALLRRGVLPRRSVAV